jgi:valyl-tRNA synthetase
VSKTRAVGTEEHLASRRVLVYVWDTSLRLLHPFMPFVTEVSPPGASPLTLSQALWQLSPHQGPSLMLSDWPKMGASELAVDKQAIRSFALLQAIVRTVRNTRAGELLSLCCHTHLPVSQSTR